MKGNLFGVLFFGVFAAAGIGIFVFQGVPMISQSTSAQSWVETPARLQSHSLGVSHGDDSTTYQAKAEFSYYYQGQTYQSDQVGWSKGYDNIGSYQQDMADRLRLISNQGGDFKVWVNPDKPAEAVIDPNLRWSMLLFTGMFLLIFGGVGIGGLVYTVLNWGNGAAIKGADHEQPWLHYKEWSQATRVSNSKLGARAMLAFAVFWNLISSFAFFVAIDSVRDGDYAALLALIFPAIGLLLLVFWYRMHRSYQRTGPMPLTLDPFPGSIGGQMGGHIVISNRTAGLPTQSEVTLQCVRKYRSGKETRETVLWQLSMAPAWKYIETGLQASFCFDLIDDSDLRESEPPMQMPGVAWRLQLEMILSDGQKIDREYVDLPVFRTGQQSSIRDREAHRSTSSASKQAHQQLVNSVLDIVPVNGGHQLVYPAYQHWAGLLMGVIGLVFVVIGLAIPDLVFNIFFPLIGGLVGLAGLAWFGSGLTVRVGPEGITSKRTIFSIALKPQFVPSYSFKELTEKKSHSTSTGRKTVQYYSLVAHGNQGEQATVAKNLKNIEQVDAAKERLMALIKP